MFENFALDAVEFLKHDVIKRFESDIARMVLAFTR